MTFSDVQIREPRGSADASPVLPRFVRPESLVILAVSLIIARHPKLHVPRVAAKPDSVLFDEWEHFLIGNSVLIADDGELLIMLHELSNVLTEEAKRWVSDHDVSLVEQSHALG